MEKDFFFPNGEFVMVISFHVFTGMLSLIPYHLFLFIGLIYE